jgi:hypothetical protein
MVIQVKKNSEKFSSFVGNVLSVGLQPSYLWFQASLFSLKGFEHQMGNFSYPVKTGLSGFGNWTIQFWKPDSGFGNQTPVSAFLTPNSGETYLFTLISFPLSRTSHGELLGPLGGDFLIPLWNLRVLVLIQLPKNRCIRFPHRFSPFQGALCRTMRKKGGSRKGAMSLNSIN